MRNVKIDFTTLFLGGFGLLSGLFLAVFSVQDVIWATPGPKRMTLAQAARTTRDERQYVVIEDGVWDCDSITYRAHQRYPETRILLTDNVVPKHIVLQVTMSGKMECADFESLELTGYLRRMGNWDKQELIKKNRLAAYPETTEFLEMCGDCSLGNSLLMVAGGVVMAGGGLLLLIESPQLAKMSKEEQKLRKKQLHKNKKFGRQQIIESKRLPKRRRMEMEQQQQRRFGFFGYKAKDLSQEPKKKKRKPIRWFLRGEANPFQDSPPDDSN